MRRRLSRSENGERCSRGYFFQKTEQILVFSNVRAIYHLVPGKTLRILSPCQAHGLGLMMNAHRRASSSAFIRESDFI